jgi:putative membrane protein
VIRDIPWCDFDREHNVSSKSPVVQPLACDRHRFGLDQLDRPVYNDSTLSRTLSPRKVSGMLSLLMLWVLSAVSLTIVANLLPGVRIRGFGTALVVAGIYGILHVLFYKILAIIAFIPMLLTFGFFAFVINAFLLFLTDKLVDDFRIDGFLMTLVAAVVLTILNNIWRLLLPI